MYQFKCQVCDQINKFMDLYSLISGIYHALDDSVQVELSYTCQKCGTVHEGSSTIEFKVVEEGGR